MGRPRGEDLNAARPEGVPAFAALDRGMLDVLSVDKDGRLAVIDPQADDDLHLALQGLDYWVRVRWHHVQTRLDRPAARASGWGSFSGMVISPA